MKKSIFLLATTVLLAACSKDDDTEKILPITLLEVQIGDNYFDEPGETGYVFASKEDGTLLDYKPIANNTTVLLETGDVAVTAFTATILTNRIGPEDNGTSLVSYIGVSPSSAWELNGFDPNSGPSGSVKVVIENTGSVAQTPFFISGSEAQGYSVDYSNNSLSLELTSDLATAVYAVYKSNLDNQVRYLFDDAVTPGVTETYEHTSLPIISAPTVVDFGQSQINYHGVWGNPVGSNEKLLSVAGEANIAGVAELYVPSNIFEKYYSFTNGILASGTQFTKAIYSQSITTNFVAPNFDFGVSENPDGFELTTSDDFDMFTAFYNNTVEEVRWSVVGEQKSTVNFLFPTIPAEIQAAFSEVSADLNLVNTSGVKHDPPLSYSDYLNNGFSWGSFNSYESIIKNQ